MEFTFLALLLMVPLVYFIITMGQIQGGSSAVVGAADRFRQGSDRAFSRN